MDRETERCVSAERRNAFDRLRSISTFDEDVQTIASETFGGFGNGRQGVNYKFR